MEMLIATSLPGLTSDDSSAIARQALPSGVSPRSIAYPRVLIGRHVVVHEILSHDLIDHAVPTLIPELLVEETDQSLRI